jgi:hypothetical protein
MSDGGRKGRVILVISSSGMPGRGRLGRVLAGGAGVCLAAALLGSSVAAAAAAVPRVAATVAGSLFGVSCFSTGSCVAVGQRSSTAQGPGGTLAEKWNGTKWSVVTSPNPAGSDGARLGGVACTAATSCLAVGNYRDGTSGDTLPMAEKWNGTAWSLVTVPAPSGSTSAVLDGVACTGASNCFAVGNSMDNTLTERWNGAGWSIVSSPSPNPSKPNVLSGVACPSASLCWAVGYTFPTTFTGSLTEKWNGTKWTVVHTPNSSAGELIGDACSSPTDCVSAGIGNGLFAIGQLWNGTTWAKALPKKPAGATESELNGVSCPAGGAACESAGSFTDASGSPALAEGWNGTAWALQSTPAISGSTFATLESVSCTTASNCWAVGVNDTSSGSDPLIEKWNGTAWSVTAS